MGTKLDVEIDQFNSSFWDWINNWFSSYYIFNDSDFIKDIDLYFSYFFDNHISITKDNKLKILNFSRCIFNSNRDLNGNHEKLYKWKFGARNWNNDKDKIYEINEIDDVISKYGNDSLVSLIYWKHILEPLQNPIFDQRVLRSFLLLSKIQFNHDTNILWMKGVPSGKKLYEFYESEYKSYVLKQIDSLLSEKDKFIKLRLIDWALFGFDTYITSESIGKFIQINKTINSIISDKLNERNHEKWEIKFS